MEDYECLLYEQRGGIVKLTLNRPGKLNALSDQLMRELSLALDRIAADSSVRVLILGGAGRAFSAGYDLSAPRDHPLDNVKAWRDQATRGECEIVMKLWDLPKPVVAAVQGYALGGGCDLVLAADIAVAAEDAVFGQPDVRFVSSPSTMLLPWAIGMKKTREILLTGDSIKAPEAERIGLVNRVVPIAELDAATWAMAEKLARIPPISLKLNKTVINRTYEIMGLRSALSYATEVFALLLITPESVAFGKAVKEKGMKAALAELETQGGPA